MQGQLLLEQQNDVLRIEVKELYKLLISKFPGE